MGASRDRWDSPHVPSSPLSPPWRSFPTCNPATSRRAPAGGARTHRKTAILGWILFVVLATVIGGKVGQQNLESSKMGNGESKRHDIIVDDANFPDEIGERVLIQGKGAIKADSPEVTAAVKDVVHRLDQIEGVSDIESPLNAEGPREHRLDGRPLRARDLHAARQGRDQGGAGGARDGSPTRRSRPSPPSRRRIPSCASRSTAARPSARRSARTERADEAKSQQISMGGTLIILLLVFGAAVAAGVPLLLGISAFVATTGLLGPVSQLTPLHEAVADRHDADRPGRRRRLRDVLPAPDDGGAGQGPLVRRTRWTSPPPPRAARC